MSWLVDESRESPTTTFEVFLVLWLLKWSKKSRHPPGDKQPEIGCCCDQSWYPCNWGFISTGFVTFFAYYHIVSGRTGWARGQSSEFVSDKLSEEFRFAFRSCIPTFPSLERSMFLIQANFISFSPTRWEGRDKEIKLCYSGKGKDRSCLC